MLDTPVHEQARRGAARRQAEAVHAYRHAAGMGVTDLDMAVDHHGGADEAHGPHADGIAERLELFLQLGDRRVGVALADRPQARRLLAERHRDILGAAEPDADDGRLTGQPALAEGDQDVEEEPLDAVDPVARKQHAVIGAEQAALVHGGDVDPPGVGLERVLDLRRVDADIVVVIGAPQRMHPVGPQGNLVGRPGGGAANRRLERDEAALDGRLVADLDVIARQAGVAAHGAAVLLRRLPVLEHG